MQLRPYQIEAIAKLRQLLGEGKKRLVLQMTTGGGKTVVAAELIRLASEKGRRVLFLAHRRELVRQCSDKLRQFGVHHQIIMVGEDSGALLVAMSNPVQVASKDTLWSRAVRSKKLDLPPADLIIADECHRSNSRTWRELLGKYPVSTLIGLTATPARGDGRGLNEIYDGMVQAISCEELIKQGYLVPYKVFAPYRPDMKGVKVVAGDYQRKELEFRMDKVELVGDIVDNWLQLAQGRQTIVFASGVAHSIHLMEAFKKAGIVAAHLDGKTPLDERDEIMRKMLSGEITVLSNVDCCTEGTDIPSVGCIVLARPTKSIVRYKQMVGRGMRVWEGKEDAILLDHSGCVYKHGFPDEEVPWTLDGKEKIDAAFQKAKKEGKGKEPIVCKHCHAVFHGVPKCPNCGAEARQKKGKAVQTKDGLLKELKRGETYAATQQELQTYWHYVLGITANIGKSLGCAATMFKQQFRKLPWEVQDLWPMPKSRDDWKRQTRDVYPNYQKTAKPKQNPKDDPQGHFF